jgi:hypothetical protein
VDGRNPKEVKELVRMVRKAISTYIASLQKKEEEIPTLISIQTNGVAWDWMKPCYHETITYQCDVKNDL